MITSGDLQDDWDAAKRLTDNDVAASILVLAQAQYRLTNKTMDADSFGHELCVGLRLALTGNDKPTNLVRDLSVDLSNIAAAIDDK